MHPVETCCSYCSSIFWLDDNKMFLFYSTDKIICNDNLIRTSIMHRFKFGVQTYFCCFHTQYSPTLSDDGIRINHFDR
jgi:hypothetical protein